MSSEKKKASKGVNASGGQIRPESKAPQLIARPKPGLPFSQGQPLLEHAANVARTSGKFAEPFASEELLHAAGFLHDVGKAADSWQRYLRENMGRE
jgi:hypothetical protein